MRFFQLARTRKNRRPRSRSALELRESLLDHKFGSALGVRTYPLTGAVYLLDILFASSKIPQKLLHKSPGLLKPFE